MKTLLLVGAFFCFTTTSYSNKEPLRFHFEVPPSHGVRTADEESLKELMSGFDRAGVESHPRPEVTLKRTFLELVDEIDNRVPLRDAVEKIPIEGQLGILRYDAIESEDVPFSRGHVEAFPEISNPVGPNVLLYSALDDGDPDFTLETRESHQTHKYEPYELSGFRGDVEAGHKIADLDPLEVLRKSASQEVPQTSSIWDVEDTKLSTSHSTYSAKRSKGKIVCYMGSWAVFRARPMNFDSDKVDPKSCTHLIYSHANMNDKTFEVKPLNYEQDIIRGNYKSTVALTRNNLDLQVLIRIGAWDEGGYWYSKMASTPENRKKFVDSVMRTLELYEFDGIDFNWNFPGSPDYGGDPKDRENLVLLAGDLKRAFTPKRKILTMSIPIDKARLDLGYDMAALSKSVDFFNLKSYDLRGPWDGKIDHHAPISKKSTDGFLWEELNLKDGVTQLVKAGAQRDKLILGIPFYGRSYMLRDNSKTHPGALSASVGREFPYTKAKGLGAYFEICAEQRNAGWTVKKDELGGTYMFKDGLWIGYDDEENVQRKVHFSMSEGLGGVGVYSLDLDDFLAVCGKKNPLLSAVTRAMEDAKPYHANPTLAISQIASQRDVAPQVSQQQPAGTGLEGQRCDSSKRIRHPTICSSYFECVNNKLSPNSCPSGLYFDESIGNCNWPFNVKCDGVASGPSGPLKPDHIKPTPGTTATPAPPPVDLKPVTPSRGSLSGDYVVVCYFTNWAWYRPGIGKYKPADIDPGLCTHILYGFAVLDYSNLVIKTHDSWADIDNNFYTQVTAFKAKGVKVLLALGGWNDSQGDKYSRLVHSGAARKKFADHAIGFLKKYNFDGLDLDWEYPVCWQVKCEKGKKQEKQLFTAWVMDLHTAFQPHGFLLTAAVSPNPKVVDLGYDVPVISQYLDWIAVMTYDYYGSWDKRTGHHSPMYSHPELNTTCFNVDCSIKHWLYRGAPKNKLVLGMPMYGRAFQLDDVTQTGLNVSARQKARKGAYTREPGFLAYYEICHHLQQGWRVVYDKLNRMGPYAVGGNQWVGYDDPATIQMKSEYVRKVGLLGGMIWALDLDDFRDRCGQGAHPLLNTIKTVLGPPRGSFSYDGTGFPPVPGEGQPTTSSPTDQPLVFPGPEPKPVPQPVPQPIPEPEPEEVEAPFAPPGRPVIKPDSFPAQPKDGYKVVCYFTNWAWYRQGIGKFLPEDIDASLCTHIIYGFAVLNANTYKIKPHDSWADLDNKFYSRVVAYKSKGIKVLLAIGGWNDSKGPKYSKMVNNPGTRAAFNSHVLGFIQKYNFDGLDLDWEYPKCWQVDCNKGPASDKEAFTMWIKELKTLFAPHGLLLTAAVSPNSKVIDAGYDVPSVSQYLDFISVMTYDYHGQWDKQTGHNAPMYDYPESPNHHFNANFTMHYWLSKGADRKKLIMGMPMYGQSFSLAYGSGTGLNQKSQGGGQAGPFTRARGFLAYYEICHFIKNENWKVERKYNAVMGPYAYKGRQWVGFDDVPKIREKSMYVKNMGFGGAMIWALDLDDFKNRCGCEAYPLLKTINRVLRAHPEPDPGCNDLGPGAPPPPVVTPDLPTPAVPPLVTPATPAQTDPPTPERTPSHLTAPVTQPSVDPSTGAPGAPCKDGEFRRHPTDCSKFFECYKGKQREVICFTGLYWDGIRMCTKKEYANCDKAMPLTPITDPPVVPTRRTTMTAPTTRRTTESTTTKLYVVRNPTLVSQGTKCSTNDFIRHPTMCDRFYECLHGKRNLVICHTGLYFNIQTGYCDWKNKVSCTPSAAPQQPETQTPKLPTTESSTQWTPPVHSPTTQPPWAPWTPPTTSTTTTSSTTTTTPHPPWSWESWTKSTVPHWTPKPKPTPVPWYPASPAPDSTGFKVVCYFTNWAWYRPGVGKYMPSDIDPDLCTHIIYGFAVLNPNTLTIKPHDTWADFDNFFYHKVTEYKRKGTKVLIAIGGWNDSLGNKYSKMIHSQASRAKFISHVVEFMTKHNFDGLDLDWEYPVCWQVDCNKGPKTDREMFSVWIKELHAALKPKFLLTAAVSPSYKVIDLGYNVPDLNRYLDFINVMTYDYHGHWDKATGHVAPLYDFMESPNPKFNANFTMNYYVKKGADRKKLIMGMPLYGQSFTLRKAADNGLNALTEPPHKGKAGKHTRAAGFLAYYEICEKALKQQYTVVKDPSGSIGPYIYKGRQWVGFDDAQQIRRKSEFIKRSGFGGGMIWALDLDDFANSCGCENYPLLRTINRVLRNYPAISQDCSIG